MKRSMSFWFLLFLFIISLVCCIENTAQQQQPSYSIETVAGGGHVSVSDQWSTVATDAILNDPKDMFIHETSGDIYLVDEFNIRKITKTSGNITKVFGTSTFGFPAAGASMNIVPLGNLTGIVLDPSSEHIYFSTFYSTVNYVYRVLENSTNLPSALVHTSNEITKFQLASTLPNKLIVYLDSKQNKVWKKDPQASEISILSTGLNQPQGINMVDRDTCYISDTGNNLIKVLNISSNSIDIVTSMESPTSSGIDEKKRLFMTSGRFVKRMTIDGNVSIIAGSLNPPYSGDDNLDATLSFLKKPISIQIWKSEIYFIDREDKKIRKLIPRCNSGYMLSSDKFMCEPTVPVEPAVPHLNFTCFGISFNETLVCSGNGNCTSQDVCLCKNSTFNLNSDCSIFNQSIIANNSQPVVDPIVNNNFTIWLSKYSDTINSSQQSQVGIFSQLTELLIYDWICLNCSSMVNYTIQSHLLNIESGSIPGTYVFQAKARSPQTGLTSNIVNFILFVSTSSIENLKNYFTVLGMPTLITSKKNDNVEYDFIVSKIEMKQHVIDIWMKDCTERTDNCKFQYSLRVDQKVGSQIKHTVNEHSLIEFSPNTSFQTASLKSPLVFKYSSMTSFVTDLQLTFALNFTNLEGSEILYSIDIPVFQYMKPLDSKSLFLNSTLLEGVAIRDSFTISISSWNSSVALQYAVGINFHGQLLRITDFSFNRTVSIRLPFLKQTKTFISIIGMDNQRNVEVAQSSIPFFIAPFDEGPSDLISRAKTSYGNFNMIASITYDLTFDRSRELTSQLIKNTLIDNNQPINTLYLLKYLTETPELLEHDSILNVQSKIAQLLTFTKESYQNSTLALGYISTKLLETQVELSLSIISNIILLDFNGRKLIDFLCEILILGEIPSTINATLSHELPKLEFNSRNINLTISTFKSATNKNQQKSTIMQGNQKVTMDLNSILAMYNAFDKNGAISLVNYESGGFNYSRNSSTSILDLKFFKENQIVKLDNLEIPIVLSFTKVEHQLETDEISCEYLNEESNSWRTDGCFVNKVSNNFIECACNHTTMFTTFLGQKRVVTTNAISIQVSDTYFAQISFGIVYLIISLLILMSLIVLRNTQPVKSRLTTPYIGIFALIIECSLIYIVQRGILVDQLVRQTKIDSKENQLADSSSTLIANIVMIFVNSLNLTAILSYLIQVIRYQLLKYFYEIISITKKSDRLLKGLKIMTSKKVIFTCLLSFFIVNLCYWTLWVILLGTKQISLEVFTYITSISYATTIITMGSIISLVFLIDISLTFVQSKKKNLVELFSLDGPLFFRFEMILFVLSFIFMILNISLGLSTLPLRFRTEDSYVTILSNDNASFAFEVIYLLFYVLVFGGFSCLVSIIYKFKSFLNRKRIQLEENNNSDENKELFTLLSNSTGNLMFEQFCKKEFSTENLYLYNYLKENNLLQGTKTKGNVNSSVEQVVSHIYENFIKAGSIMEVNIPSSCNKSMTNLYKQYCCSSDTMNTSSKGEGNDLNMSDSIVFENIDTLMENVLVNLSDTFSRFVFTDDYISFANEYEMRDQALSKFNLQ